MGLPYLNGQAELLEDPSFSRNGKGKGTTLVQLRFSSERFDKNLGRKVPGDSFEIEAICFGDQAESVKEGVVKGDLVNVVGRVKGDTVNTPDGLRPKPFLFIDTIGHTL